MSLKDSFKKNYKKIAYFFSGILILALVFYSYLEWQNKVEKDLSLAINEILLKEEEILADEGEEDKINNLIQEYLDLYQQNPNKVNGIRAFYLAASLEMNQKKFSSSQQKFQSIVDNNPKHFLTPHAYLNLILIDEINKNYDQALVKLEDFEKKILDHYLKNEVKLIQGRIYAKLKNYQIAKSFFEEIILDTKVGEIGINAKERIDFLKIKGLLTNQ